MDPRKEVFDFVGLHMADHVPEDVLGQPLGLSDQFLHAVFSKVFLPHGVRFHQILVWLGLAHGHQGQFSVRTFLRTRQLALHRQEPLL